MPATVRVGSRELLTAIRRHDGEKHWIETYRSLDDGESWTLDEVPAPDLGEGNPASLIRLIDGRLCLTYGHRAPSRSGLGLAATGGITGTARSFSVDDCGGRDMGYPRSVHAHGKIVTVYYSWDRKTGPERYIAATIWNPD